ncbi:MAG: DMT family transporter [Kiloniellales bacterium]
MPGTDGAPSPSPRDPSLHAATGAAGGAPSDAAPPARRALVLTVALLAVVLWGGSPIATKLAVAELDPFAVGALRSLIGALPAVAILAVLRLPFPRSGSGRGLLAVSSLCGFVVFPMLFSLALQWTTAAHGGLALAILPLTTALIAAFFERRMPSRRWWLGAAVALAGTLLLIDRRFGLGSSGASVKGDLLVLLSCLAASAGYVTGGRAAREIGARAVTFWGLALAGLPLLLATPLLIAPRDLGALSPSAWGALIYLGVMISIVGYLGWYWALAQGDMTRTALVQFLQPAASLLFAVVVLGEILSWPLLVAGAVIIAGVALVQTGGPGAGRKSVPTPSKGAVS